MVFIRPVAELAGIIFPACPKTAVGFQDQAMPSAGGDALHIGHDGDRYIGIPGRIGPQLAELVVSACPKGPVGL